MDNKEKLLKEKIKILDELTICKIHEGEPCGPHYIRSEDLKYVIDDLEDFAEKSIGSTCYTDGRYRYDVEKYLRLKILYNK